MSTSYLQNLRNIICAFPIQDLRHSAQFVGQEQYNIIGCSPQNTKSCFLHFNGSRCSQMLSFQVNSKPHYFHCQPQTTLSCVRRQNPNDSLYISLSVSVCPRILSILHGHSIEPIFMKLGTLNVLYRHKNKIIKQEFQIYILSNRERKLR